jgi:hypothetical protein
MNHFNDKRISVPQRKLRRLAPRYIAIFQKWEGRSPQIRALGGTGTAERYIDLCDELVVRRADRRIEVAQKREAIVLLADCVRRWRTLIAHYRPIDPEEYRVVPESPDDVIASAERVLRLVADGGPLHGVSFAADLRDTITPLVEDARRERAEAAAATGEAQVIARALREAARELQAELKRFRMLLRAEVGTSHADYQELRASRVRDDDDGDAADGDAGDDESIPLESSVTSDAPVAGAPRTDPPEAGADDGRAPESDVA